ncbi:unnamed protein product, partial [marine sediment metagenome]
VIGEELIDAFEEVKGDLELTQDDKLYFLKDNDETIIPEGYIDLMEQIKHQDMSKRCCSLPCIYQGSNCAYF